MTNARSKDVVIFEEPKLRAVILGQDLKTQVESQKELFTGEYADFYAAIAAKTTGEGTKVIGASIQDCYEMALQRTCQYVGESANHYMSLELKNNGFIPTVISPEDFEKLLTKLT